MILRAFSGLFLDILFTHLAVSDLSWLKLNVFSAKLQVWDGHIKTFSLIFDSFSEFRVEIGKKFQKYNKKAQNTHETARSVE
jgi:hypothetical protein